MKALFAIFFVFFFTQETTYKEKFKNDELLIQYSIVKEGDSKYMLGKIQRNSDGINIPGMNIVAENNSEGTVSNHLGEFRVALLANSSHVKFSHNMFKTVQLKVK